MPEVNSTNPAALISISSTQRTDFGTLPIDPVYAAIGCIMAVVLIPALVIGIKGRGEAKRLRDDEATLAATRAATEAKVRALR